ncbi:MAG TPA: hypothetical protein VGD21_15540 [Lysobacter sp.]
MITIVSSLIATGCQPAMSTPIHHNPPENRDVSRPFTFDRHNFGAYCYDTYGCKVLYNDRYVTSQDDNELRPSSASVGPDYLKNLDGGYLGIANFPPPAVVTWRSKDGTPHEAHIDIGEIFKDRIIRHNVPREELPTETTATAAPDIVLEVNDRTINVYMKAFVSTRSLQVPGNQYSDFRNDMILAFSQTY